MPRPRKKPNYNPEIVMKELVAEVVELYATSEKEVSIRQIADDSIENTKTINYCRRVFI